MGHHNARLSWRVKNYERKQTSRRSVGRPPKRNAPAHSPPTPTPPDLSSAVSTVQIELHPLPSPLCQLLLQLRHHHPFHQVSMPSPTPPLSILSGLDLPGWWVVQDQKDKIGICKISSQPSTSTGSLVITHCIIVNTDLTWSVSIHDCLLDAMKCSALSKVPS